ncbi:MAG: DUF167 domain-containing protein [Alphaproteobacteria bacterium]
MIINVSVVPRAKQNKIDKSPDGTLKIHTTAAPTDGDANSAVVKMLAEYFDVPKSKIKIIRGETARKKIVSIPKD